MKKFRGGREQIRTAVEGFADLNLTTRSHGLFIISLSLQIADKIMWDYVHFLEHIFLQ
jgi:hypothetical protein